jgi:hypothetical protein
LAKYICRKRGEQREICICIKREQGEQLIIGNITTHVGERESIDTNVAVCLSDIVPREVGVVVPTLLDEQTRQITVGGGVHLEEEKKGQQKNTWTTNKQMNISDNKEKEK